MRCPERSPDEPARLRALAAGAARFLHQRQRLQASPADRAIVRNVVHLAGDLGLEVFAERYLRRESQDRPINAS